jgi:hypothetical protein
LIKFILRESNDPDFEVMDDSALRSRLCILSIGPLRGVDAVSNPPPIIS